MGITITEKKLPESKQSGGGGKNISKADFELLEKLLGESGKTISDADRKRLEAEGYLKKNDGGMVRKTRTF